MSSKIKAVISFNKREEIREWIALRILLILLVIIVFEEAKAIAQPTVIFIDNAEASTPYPLSLSSSQSETDGNTAYSGNREQIAQVIERADESQEGSAHSRIVAIAKEKGFENIDGLLRLATCESSMGTRLIHKNNDRVKSTDFGLWMINDYWHKEVTREQAMDIDWSTRWTIDKIQSGGLSQWNCSEIFNDTSYKII